MSRAFLLQRGLQLSLLIGRENAHDLRVQRFARLRIGSAPFGMLLPELRDVIADLRALRIGEIEAPQRPHHAGAMMVPGPSGLIRCRSVRRLLSTRDERQRKCKPERRGEEGRGSFHGAIVRPSADRNVNARLEKRYPRPMSSSFVPPGSSKKKAG